MDTANKKVFALAKFDPLRAIMLSYNIYTGDNANNGPLTRSVAQHVVENMLAELKSFEGDPDACQYLNDWYLSVAVCCANITRIKRIRDTHERTIRHAHDERVGLIGRNIIVGALLNAAWQLLLAGVVGVSVYAMLLHGLEYFHLHVAPEYSHPGDPRISAGIGVVVTGILFGAWRAWSHPRRTRHLTRRFLREHNEIHARADEAARVEFRACKARVAALWENYHGAAAPDTCGAENLLGIGDERFEEPAPVTAKESRLARLLRMPSLAAKSQA